MVNNNTQDVLRARIDAFVEELSVLIRNSALNAVQEALGEQAPARRGPGRPRKSGRRKARKGAKAARKSAKKTARKARAKASGGRVRRGTRRSEAAVDAVAAQVVTHVRANPGCAISDIKSALGLSTKDLQLPVRKLVAEGKLRTTGQKRGTRYHTGSGRPASAKKRGKRKAARKTAKRKASAKKGARKTGKKPARRKVSRKKSARAAGAAQAA